MHQGNGTAALFKDNPYVFTFSMHGAANYPLHKEKSDLDIALIKGTQDDVYLSQLKKVLPQLIEQERPDFIHFQAGVDILQTDKLGLLSISKEGCRARDEFVLSLAKEKEIPIAITMGGGYSNRIATIIDAHTAIYRIAQFLYF